MNDGSAMRPETASTTMTPNKPMHPTVYALAKMRFRCAPQYRICPAHTLRLIEAFQCPLFQLLRDSKGLLLAGFSPRKPHNADLIGALGTATVSAYPDLKPPLI
jgi:hypothetical protein